MDASTGIAEFLTNRRAGVTPEQVGLPDYRPRRTRNSAPFAFLDPAAGDFCPEWDRVDSELVAHLRSHAGANPYDRQLSGLIGELSTPSDDFR
jgi:hypothetical protein